MSLCQGYVVQRLEGGTEQTKGTYRSFLVLIFVGCQNAIQNRVEVLIIVLFIVFILICVNVISNSVCGLDSGSHPLRVTVRG